MEEPLVSIIIPCYNSEQFLPECIQSLLEQTYANCEIIVIDDGSNDGSLKIIEKYSSCIRYETGPNKGACAARNRGLEIATGEFIKLCDADDVIPPDAIAKQVEAMQQLGPNEIIYGKVLDLESKKTVYNKVQTSPLTSRDEMVFACFSHDILIGCPLHRRQFLIDHNILFDNSILQGQEWNFHLAIALAGGVFVYDPSPVYYYRKHESPDRISQILKNKAVNLTESWLAQASGCRMIIRAYQNGKIPNFTKTKMLKRLCKLEAKLASMKVIDHARAARDLRKQLQPAWSMLLGDIKSLPRRCFSK